MKQAKEQCDYLIVGINSDDLMYDYKNKHPIINEEARKIVVEACKYVDEVHIIESRDRIKLWETYHFNKLFVGDDWKGTDTWNQIESNMKGKCQVIYLKHTEGISSTSIRNSIQG